MPDPIESLRARLWIATKGSYGRWVGLALAGALVTFGVLGVALVVPGLRSVAVIVALGDVVLMALILVAMLARSAGQAQEAAANISLQSHLARDGFMGRDFFVDGAAASPNLQLLIAKILGLCQPDTILELGSGQTTKALAHYARTHPEARILTIEEHAEWHQRMSLTLNAPENHRYDTSPVVPMEVSLPGGGTASTGWYARGKELLDGRRFQLILVDGPTNHKAGEFVRYSRSGLLPYLPAILADRFAIVLDDTENYGYAMTAHAMRDAISAAGRPVTVFYVHGVKSQTILCSPEWQFLQSV